MNLQAVRSSNLAAVGYDHDSKTMRILFVEGSMYDYFGVSEKVHAALMEADSLGSFFQQNIVGRFRFKKVNLEKESTVGKNKAQKAAEARAAKSAAPEAAATAVATEQPKQEVKTAPAPAAPAQPSKQAETVAKLKAAWAEKKVDLSKLVEKQDGKFINLIVDADWPTVRVGNSGGITVMELRSYASAFDAAVDGRALYDKQKARDQKKAAASVPAPAPTQPAPATPAVKETPTAKKAKAHEQLEQKLATA